MMKQGARFSSGHVGHERVEPDMVSSNEVALSGL